MDNRDHRAVFLSDVWRLFRRRQRNSDVGGDGFARLHDIHRANGVKNFLGICINSMAVFGFSITHMVSWPRALLMAVAATIGGYVGARIAQRVGQTFISRAIVVIGFVITMVMLWRMW